MSSLIRDSSPRATWWVTFVLVAAVGTCWALASPPYSAIDEPLHVIKAVSIARGQWVGDTLPADQVPANEVFKDGWATFDIPAVYTEAEIASRCFRGGDHKTEPADCFSFTGSSATAEVVSLDPRYPPAYYLAVGLPARFVPDGPNAVRAMRVLSVAIVAAFVASAHLSLRRLRFANVASIGLLLATTPMAIHMASSVNPSGVEIGAAIALWASGVVLVREAATSIDRRLVVRVAVAGVVLVLTRPASPLFALLIAIALTALADRAALQRLLRDGAARLAGVAIAAAAVAQTSWNQLVEPHYYGVPIPDGVARSEVVRFAIGKTPDYYRQMIGVFGSPDLYVNAVTILLWSVMLGGIVFAAVAVGRRRSLLVMLGILAVAIAMPIAADVSQSDRFSYAWQGRYTIPLVVGIPLLAGIAVAESAAAPIFTRTRLLAVFAAGFTVAQFLAYAEFLQRYTVGVNGPLAFFLDPVWSPPVPAALLLVAALVSIAALSYFVLFLRSDRGELGKQARVVDALSATDRGTVEQHARSET